MTTTALNGVPVAITGAAHGIGRATAERLASAGARVALGDLDLEAAQAAARSIGGDAIAAALDVADPDAFATFLEKAEAAHGPLGVLVNNAGIDWIGPFHQESNEITRREIEVNLVGTITGTRLALRRMLPRRQGQIVNVASGAGRVPLPGSATYSATKHGIVGLTESLRLEYSDSGVRFSLIQPAQVETEMLRGQARPKLLPVVTPEAVADAIVEAVRRQRFEVWVPRSQGVTAKLGTVLPRRARETLLRLIGVGRIAGETDAAARRDYHDRMFGSP